MQYTLSVHQRLMLLAILPAEGNLTTIRIVRELREALSFSEAEHRTLNIRQEEGRIYWDENAAQERQVEIGPKAAGVIREALGNLDEAGRLTIEHVALCDLFEYEAG